MEFSEKWLLNWISSDIKSDTIYDQIIRSGIEIEQVTKVLSDFKNIVVGKIIQCFCMNNKTKSFFLKVKISDKKIISIISFSNFKFLCGMKVVIATSKSKLSNNRSITTLQFNDKISEGVICSFKDLGMLNVKNTIIEISSEIPVGSDLCNILSFNNDNIIKISSPTNRFDNLSILGIAREISALNNLPLPKLKKYYFSTTDTKQFKIVVKNKNICSRFFGRIIKNVDINRQTPIWLLERLRRSSILSQNVITDIINYVLIELGQPIYLFNSDNISQHLIIRTAYENEEFIDENCVKHILSKNTIVISNDKKTLMLSNHTRSYFSKLLFNSKNNVFIGCALFNVATLHNNTVDFNFGAKNQFTERYDRGIDSDIQNKALDYVTYLILKICGGDAEKIISNVSLKKCFFKKEIKFFVKNFYKYVKGINDDYLIAKYLLQFGYLIEKKENYWLVTPPSWRFDIKIEEDIFSELVRIFGYKNIPSIELLTHFKIIKEDEQMYSSLDRVKFLLVDLGYNEVITYGFVDPRIQKLLFPEQKPLNLLNPISQTMSSMRLSLWPGLLSTVIYNQNRQKKVMRFFESGLCFVKDETKKLGVQQNLHLSGILSGYTNEIHWKFSNKIVDFYDLKGDLELILELLRKLNLVQFRRMYIPGLCSGQCAALFLKDEMIGSIGVVSPIIEKKLNLKYKTIIFELIWKKVASYIDEFQVQNVSEYPISSRDIAIIVDELISVDDIIQTCQNISSDEIIRVKLFDIFREKKIGQGKKSLAFQLTFGSKFKTLSDTRILLLMNECIKTLKIKFNAVLRDKHCVINK